MGLIEKMISFGENINYMQKLLYETAFQNGNSNHENSTQTSYIEKIILDYEKDLRKSTMNGITTYPMLTKNLEKFKLEDKKEFYHEVLAGDMESTTAKKIDPEYGLKHYRLIVIEPVSFSNVLSYVRDVLGKINY